MKKFLGIFAFCLFTVIAFAGCGVAGSKTVAGIEFVRDVFYVDFNVETKLDYRIYPSTADNYYVTIDVNKDESLTNYFTFRNGKVTIDDARFAKNTPNYITVKARVNNMEDSCQVRLREYPKMVSFASNTDVINSGSIYSLNLRGVFEEETRYCNAGEFNYKVTSSDPSVVKVKSESDLLVQSTGRRGYASIRVELCNSQGRELGLSATIGLSVVDILSEAYATFGDRFVMTNGGAKSRLVVSSGDEFKIQVRYFNAEGYLIENADFKCFLSNSDVADIVKKSDGTYIRIKAEGSVELMIVSAGNTASGLPIQIKYKVTVHFS